MSELIHKFNLQTMKLELVEHQIYQTHWFLQNQQSNQKKCVFIHVGTIALVRHCSNMLHVIEDKLLGMPHTNAQPPIVLHSQKIGNIQVGLLMNTFVIISREDNSVSEMFLIGSPPFSRSWPGLCFCTQSLADVTDSGGGGETAVFKSRENVSRSPGRWDQENSTAGANIRKCCWIRRRNSWCISTRRLNILQKECVMMIIPYCLMLLAIIVYTVSHWLGSADL